MTEKKLGIIRAALIGQQQKGLPNFSGLHLSVI
jgi:hypothetical protein